MGLVQKQEHPDTMSNKWATHLEQTTAPPSSLERLVDTTLGRIQHGISSGKSTTLDVTPRISKWRRVIFPVIKIWIALCESRELALKGSTDHLLRRFQ